MKLPFLFIASCLLAMACTQKNQSTHLNLETSSNGNLYASKGVERQVSFTALYQTSYTNLSDVQNQPSAVGVWEIARTVKFLFGPLVYRELGGPQRGEKITIHPEQAVMKNGLVHVPYDYTALWLVSKDFPADNVLFPLPYQANMQQTPRWASCGDAAPEHQSPGFYWYFWDPTRYGCDHLAEIHYQNVKLNFGPATVQTVTSYPEYKRMIQDINGEKVLQMTFAFGYVEDAFNPQPFQDTDEGMREFQSFNRKAEKILSSLGFQKSLIYQSEYDGAADLAIGTRFTGLQNGVKVVVSIVAAAGVDQMMLFAESYASRKEGFFGWFGHSRVGSGFDAQSFQSIMYSNPEKYALSANYQLIYWAGCNSYSYYTLPFFDMKAQLDPVADPKGTKNLDIISNGLPSFFHLNALNAEVMLKTLLKWETPTSYQAIVDQIEDIADHRGGTLVLVNVLGDEDNP